MSEINERPDLELAPISVAVDPALPTDRADFARMKAMSLWAVACRFFESQHLVPPRLDVIITSDIATTIADASQRVWGGATPITEPGSTALVALLLARPSEERMVVTSPSS